jgi:chemosensory pili system protein ChpA (sensor histidine kinase/response regulator)
LLAGIDTDLNSWTSDHQNINALKNLMRYLHTLKGGSNMIQARHIGLIAHELETIYEKLINQQIQPTAYLVALIRIVQDDIADRIQTIRDQHVDYPSTHVINLLQQSDQTVTSDLEIASLEEQTEDLTQIEHSQIDSSAFELAADTSEIVLNDQHEVEDTSSLETIAEIQQRNEDDEVRSLLKRHSLKKLKSY